MDLDVTREYLFLFVITAALVLLLPLPRDTDPAPIVAALDETVGAAALMLGEQCTFYLLGATRPTQT